MLNIIWTGFILVAFVAALVQAIFLHNPGVFQELVVGMMDTAKAAFEIALGLTGIMCLWLGIMKIGERGGAVDLLARGFRPLFRRLFPSIPPDSPAAGSIVVNMAANMLGLDNAATPLGLKAMKEMQELNPEKEIVVMSDSGQIYQGGSAWIMCLYALRRYRELSFKLAHPMLLPLAKKLCHIVSERRLSLSKLFACTSREQMARELIEAERLAGCEDGRCEL